MRKATAAIATINTATTAPMITPTELESAGPSGAAPRGRNNGKINPYTLIKETIITVIDILALK